MNINFLAPINELGYGTVGLHWLIGMAGLGHQVALFPIGGPERIQAAVEHHELIKTSLTNASSFENVAPCLRLWHQFDMAQRVGKGKFFGSSIFELDTFTSQEQHHLSNLDHIIVNSEWARLIVLSHLYFRNKDTVSVVPLGVNRSIFNDDDRYQTRQFKKKTVFLTVGKWEIRKGHDVLIQCFNKAFGPNDDVELQMLCNTILNPQHQGMADSIIDGMRQSPLAHKIKILPRQESHHGVKMVMLGADCGVFPSHAEGWGLETLEMMSCGKPVIVTNCTGHTEFCNKNNSMLVDVDGVEPAYDGVWFNGKQGNWAKFNDDTIDQIVQYMRQIHKQKQDGANLFNNSGIQTAEKYTWENSATKLMEILGGN